MSESWAAYTIFRLRLLGCFCGLLPLLGLAVSIDDLLVAAFSILVTQHQHLPESLDGLGIILVVAVDRSQPFQKDRPVVFLGLGVAVVGLLRLLEQVLQYLDGLVVAALGLVHRRH